MVTWNPTSDASILPERFKRQMYHKYPTYDLAQKRLDIDSVNYKTWFLSLPCQKQQVPSVQHLSNLCDLFGMVKTSPG